MVYGGEIEGQSLRTRSHKYIRKLENRGGKFNYSPCAIRLFNWLPCRSGIEEGEEKYGTELGIGQPCITEPGTLVGSLLSARIPANAIQDCPDAHGLITPSSGQGPDGYWISDGL